MSIRINQPQKGYTKRQVKTATRVALQATAAFWHETMLPIHFTTGGAAKYNYTPRTAKYMRRKARVKRHQRPLRWSGQSEMQAKQDFTVTVETISGNLAGVVTMQMPDYFVKHPNNSSTHIDKPAELTRTTDQEQGILGNVFADRLMRELDIGRSVAYG